VILAEREVERKMEEPTRRRKQEASYIDVCHGCTINFRQQTSWMSRVLLLLPSACPPQARRS